MQGDTKIAIVVLNWNGWNDTIECLESLTALSHQSFFIIVVDNASQDDSVARISDWARSDEMRGRRLGRFVEIEGEGLPENLSLDARDLVLVKASVNGGYARGNNLGIKIGMHCGAAYFWILNNDTTVHEDALTFLEREFDIDPKVGIVGSVLLYHDDRGRIQAFGGSTFDKIKARGVPIASGLTFDKKVVEYASGVVPAYISGASALVSSQFVQDVGMMEEKYFLYYEEIDWAIRASNRWRLAVSAQSVVYHKEGGSIGTATRTERSHLSQYYLNRNLILLYYKFYPYLLRYALVRILREVLRCMLRGDFSRVLVTMRALYDGLRGVEGPRS